MAAEESLKIYRCPNCGGAMKFSEHSGFLQCEYCGNQCRAEEAEEHRDAQEIHTVSAENPWGAGEEECLNEYSCPSCGAHLMCDENTAATNCPYCGSPVILQGKLSGSLKPDLVIPFKLDKEAAKTRLKQFYRRKPFLPGAFSDKNHIEELKGVYVPFWLFDAHAEGNAAFSASSTRRWREGNYEITETKYYDAERAGAMDFVKIPADGSRKMPDAYMDGIEPFLYQDLQAFSPAYLSGFLADKYDVGEQECSERVRGRTRNTIEEALRETVRGYDRVTMTRGDFQVSLSKASYVLLPVWILLTNWQGNQFMFAMNGQTGKLVGELPLDQKRYKGWFFGLFGGLFLLFLFLWFKVLM